MVKEKGREAAAGEGGRLLPPALLQCVLLFFFHTGASGLSASSRLPRRGAGGRGGSVARESELGGTRRPEGAALSGEPPPARAGPGWAEAPPFSSAPFPVAGWFPSGAPVVVGLFPNPSPGRLWCANPVPQPRWPPAEPIQALELPLALLLLGERARLFGVPPKRGRPPPGHPASPRRELSYGVFYGGWSAPELIPPPPGQILHWGGGFGHPPPPPPTMPTLLPAPSGAFVLHHDGRASRGPVQADKI